MFENYIDQIRIRKPLVHCITNYVTVTDCANILLACGASPIMADDIAEVEEITSICNALVINIGTLNSRTIESMLTAGKIAEKLGHALVLDPVGTGASRFRTQTALKLIAEIPFTVIRGNISEIKTLAVGTGQTQGVDACPEEAICESNLSEIIDMAKRLSERTKAVIAISGSIDVITDSDRVFLVRNGCQMMSRITGSGCMLTALTAAMLAGNPEVPPVESTTAAFAEMGIAGQIAEVGGGRTAAYCPTCLQLPCIPPGTAAFAADMMDAISWFNSQIFSLKAQIEQR